MINVSMFLEDYSDKAPDGKWITHPDGWRIKARPLFTWKAKEINKLAKKSGKLDHKLSGEMIVDWVVEDWDGIYGDDLKKVPCIKENKILLFNNWPEFNIFVQQVGLKLEKYYKRKEKKT